VHYTDLNKNYPKDPFALPRIDHVINSTAGRVLLSFLDYYSGYHQIALKEEDQVKTAFVTPFGVYTYTTMPPINGPSNCASRTSYTTTLKLTWMMWSSRPDPTTSSSLISRKHSTACRSFDGSLTRRSASLACHKENYSGSLLVTEELKQTQNRSTPLQPWMHQRRSRMSRSSQAAWQL
jgi:hypothetical protein